MAGFVVRNIFNFFAGFSAIGLSILFIYLKYDNPTILFASIFFLLISLTDTFYRKIPNLFTLPLILTGVTFNIYSDGLSGALTAGLGFLLGLGLFLIPFLLGGMGAGDVKALAAVGTLVGPATIFQVFLYASMIGAVMSVLHYLSNRSLLETLARWRMSLLAFATTREKESFSPVMQGETLKFPYAAAIAFGYFSFIQWGAII